MPDTIMKQKKEDAMTETWNVTLELDSTITDDAADDLMETLAVYGVSVGSGPHNRVSVTLTLPADNIGQAFATAIAVAERASGAITVGAEVLPTAEFDARSGLEPIPALVSVSEAADMLGLSKPRVNQMIGEGKFATARKVGQSYVIAYREVANLAGIPDPLDES